MTEVYILIRQDEYKQLVKGGNTDSTLTEPTTLYHSNQSGLSKEHSPSSKEHKHIKQNGRGESKSREEIEQSDDQFSSGGESEEESDDSSSGSEYSNSSVTSNFEGEKDNWFECWEGVHFKE